MLVGPDNLHTVVIMYIFHSFYQSYKLTKKTRHKAAIRDDAEDANMLNISLGQRERNNYRAFQAYGSPYL